MKRIDNNIQIFHKGGQRLIDLKSIMWVEAKGSYSVLHTTTGKVITSYTLINIIRVINDEMFVRVHRSHAVNKQFISSTGKYKLFLTNGETLLVSRRKRPSMGMRRR